jgi:hypothetical protein
MPRDPADELLDLAIGGGPAEEEDEVVEDEISTTTPRTTADDLPVKETTIIVED